MRNASPYFRHIVVPSTDCPVTPIPLVPVLISPIACVYNMFSVIFTTEFVEIVLRSVVIVCWFVRSVSVSPATLRRIASTNFNMPSCSSSGSSGSSGSSSSSSSGGGGAPGSSGVADSSSGADS